MIVLAVVLIVAGIFLAAQLVIDNHDQAATHLLGGDVFSPRPEHDLGLVVADAGQLLDERFTRPITTSL